VGGSRIVSNGLRVSNEVDSFSIRLRFATRLAVSQAAKEAGAILYLLKEPYRAVVIVA
jgi:hypothetical protein